QASPDIVDIAVATPYPGSDLFGDPRIFTSVKYSDFRHNPESAPTKEKGIRPAVTRTGVMTSEDITLSAQLMRNIFDSRNNKKEFDKYMDELNKKVEAERQNAGKNEIQPPPSGVLNGVYVAVEKNEEMIFWNWQNTGLKTSRGEIIWMSVNDGKLILFANNAAHADVVEIFNNALFQSPSSARTAYISKLLNEKLAAVNIKIEKPVVVFNMSGHNRRYNSRHISFILSVA
ncbi:MAG: hypothetical protein FWC88_05620, partial [Endomicrobia bacterium]|nr:hypothetical protein [Endomicrobiia bacterium]